MKTLQLVHRMEGTGHVVGLTLQGPGAWRTAEARFDFHLSAQDREDMRWYLEEYLQYPIEPSPQVARRVEERLAVIGRQLFTAIFGTDRDCIRLWDTAARSLADTRLEVAAGVEGAAAVPWELIRDPATDRVLALSASTFVRTHAGAARPPALHGQTGMLRVLLVICRPGGPSDVSFRSVASHLVRLSRQAREALQLDVLRPPTFAQLERVLMAAKAAGSPYHVVHFDGHGAYLDAEAAGMPLVSPPHPGKHGFLVFEDPQIGGSQQLVDGPVLGRLLADAGVPVLVLNACRSAHADLATAPETVTAELDAHQRVRAYGSLAQEVMDSGVPGVVAMRYNVYVVTAAKFIGEVYAGMLKGQELGAAVAAARRQLAADPLRPIGARLLPLQDWLVPVVYEAAPLTLRTIEETPGLVIDLSQAEAAKERASLDPELPPGPEAGFFGRDETLLALDRAFDTHPVTLLHAWAGAGKTSTALEFARWYQLTGAVEMVLFTSFAQRVPLERLLDQIGDRFGHALTAAGVQWTALNDSGRRDMALRILAQVPVLWVWDNVEPVAGFPAGTASAWTAGEQGELAGFLRELARWTRCRVLVTSRRDEADWLGDLPRRVPMPPMPMLQRLELAQAIAADQPGGRDRFLEVADWRPLLEFTQGNPLTVTILVRQALRGQVTTREQVAAFVSRLRAGAMRVTDDAVQGRDTSLAASLDYGFSQAFTEDERAQLALLALFEGFVEVLALQLMGNPAAEPVQAVYGLDQEAGIALLARAAEMGLLKDCGVGLYAVHPAVPWHLRNLFEQHYGPQDGPTALAAVRAWTSALSFLGDHYHNLYATAGRPEALEIVRAEEANLLRARQLAIKNNWHDLIIGPMQALSSLYLLAGRAIEWQRLVDDLESELSDPATGAPIPGREKEWALFTGYRVDIAVQCRDWPAAEKLQDAVITWRRDRAADALTVLPDMLDDGQWHDIHNLAVELEQLGRFLRDQQQSRCTGPFLEAIGLCQRIGDRREEAILAYNLGQAYLNTPGLRDLDQAERWYRNSIELIEEHDTLGLSRTTHQLGTVAFERFREDEDAGADEAELLRHLNDAILAYEEGRQLLPADALGDHAISHNQLGLVYSSGGDQSRAFLHFQQSIQYEERRDDRFGAGRARVNAAVALWSAGRIDDALLYARAAVRDYTSVGPGATAAAELAGRLVAELEQEQAR